jgi:hypothetical protein
VIGPTAAEKPPIFLKFTISAYLPFRLHSIKQTLKNVRVGLADGFFIKAEAVDYKLRRPLANEVSTVNKRTDDFRSMNISFDEI